MPSRSSIARFALLLLPLLLLGGAPAPVRAEMPVIDLRVGLSLIVTSKSRARQAVKDILDGVSGAEERHLREELARLLGKLVVWKYRARHRTPELEMGIEALRNEVVFEITRRPEIAGKLSDPAWMQVIWSRAVVMAASETGLHDFPEGLPWAVEDVLSSGWLPIDWDPRESERDI